MSFNCSWTNSYLAAASLGVPPQERLPYVLIHDLSYQLTNLMTHNNQLTYLLIHNLTYQLTYLFIHDLSNRLPATGPVHSSSLLRDAAATTFRRVLHMREDRQNQRQVRISTYFCPFLIARHLSFLPFKDGHARQHVSLDAPRRSEATCAHLGSRKRTAVRNSEAGAARQQPRIIDPFHNRTVKMAG